MDNFSKGKSSKETEDARRAFYKYKNKELIDVYHRLVFVKTAYAAYWNEQFRSRFFWNTLKRFLNQ